MNKDDAHDIFVLMFFRKKLLDKNRVVIVKRDDFE